MAPPTWLPLTWKGLRRCPRRTVSAFQALLLLRASHTSSRAPPSTTSSARKPGRGGTRGQLPAPLLQTTPLQGPPPSPTPQGWAEAPGKAVSSTLGVALQEVSHVELTVGA